MSLSRRRSGKPKPRPAPAPATGIRHASGVDHEYFVRLLAAFDEPARPVPALADAAQRVAEQPAFDSGEPLLDDWLTASALYADRMGTARTFVWSMPCDSPGAG